MDKALKNYQKICLSDKQMLGLIQKVAADDFGIYVTQEDADKIFKAFSYECSYTDMNFEGAKDIIKRFVNLYGNMQFALDNHDA